VGWRRRAARFLHDHPNVRLAVLLALPMLWLVVAYLGSLASLLVTSLYTINDFTTEIIRKVSLDNFRELFTEPVYRTVFLRTIFVGAAVTVIDIVIALPMAFYMAKVASPRARRALVVAVLMPLWASYLVKAYAWRAILASPGGVLDSTFGRTPGYGLTAVVLVLAYLWLPYMVLPIYAGLDRLPNSLLEASADLGAKAGLTFRKVVIPTLLPAIVAGSIFTFSLSIGDYIAVNIVGGTTQMIGTVVYANFATNLPLAAAFAVGPVVIMLIYLMGARRMGAFENL
jgi:putative spermidine/putrescine transport system permease protein